MCYDINKCNFAPVKSGTNIILFFLIIKLLNYLRNLESFNIRDNLLFFFNFTQYPVEGFQNKSDSCHFEKYSCNSGGIV
jgi:hypothetical protein